MRQIFFDIETTGLKFNEGHKIVQVAMIEYIDGKPTGRFLNEKINPLRSIDPEAQKVHGMSIESLQDKPTFKEVLPKIIEFIQDAEMIAHNGKAFDGPFMDKEFKNVGSEIGFWACCKKLTDTLVIAKKIFPRKKNNLDALCERLGIDFSNRGLHDALKDTELLADVYMGIKRTHPELEAYTRSFEEDVERPVIEKLLNKPKLRVVLANQEELATHAVYMAEIAPKSEVKLKI